MTRLNLVLVAIAIVCALGVVTAQHKSRKLFVELQAEKTAAHQLDVEWGQLQLEQSTWAMHSRVERVAGQYLHMRVPPPSRVRIVQPAGDASP